MSVVRERMVTVNGQPCRVWSKGNGPSLGYIPGVGGLTRWLPFLDRLAETRTVIVPSPPGFPGGGSLHLSLDTQLDWLLALRDLLDGSGLAGADLVAGNVAAGLIADMAAVWPASVGRLALIAPHGLFFEDEPPADLWAQRPGALAKLLSLSGEWAAQREIPADCPDAVEWQITQVRVNEAVARFSWPMVPAGVAKRLGRIGAPTLLIRGTADRVLPARYVQSFAAAISGATEIATLEGAGHLVEFDQPEKTADVVLNWFEK